MTTQDKPSLNQVTHLYELLLRDVVFQQMFMPSGSEAQSEGLWDALSDMSEAQYGFMYAMYMQKNWSKVESVLFTRGFLPEIKTDPKLV